MPDELDLMDDKILRNIDERCVRSLNGTPLIQFRLSSDR